MTRIVVDAALQERLSRFCETLELCDEAGNVLGRFVPNIDWDAIERDRPIRSEEELRFREQGPGLTVAEVLAHLEKL